MSTTHDYNSPATDTIAPKLHKAAGQVQTVFDVIAFLVIVVGAIATVVLLFNDGGPAVLILIPTWTAVVWASVKFYGIIAGYIHWRSKP